MDTELRSLNLTHTQFNLLASSNWLTGLSGPPTQQQAAELAGADRMMASKVFATLQSRGLVDRTSDDADSRVRRVVVTAAGSELVSRAVRIVADVDGTFFGDDSEARDTTRDQLRRLAQR